MTLPGMVGGGGNEDDYACMSGRSSKAGPSGSDSDGDASSCGGGAAAPLERSETSKEAKRRLPAKALTKDLADVKSLADQTLGWRRKDVAMDAATKTVIVNGILKNRFCTGLVGGAVEILLANMSCYEFNAGETIVNEGSDGNHFFVLQDGNCEVSFAGKMMNTLRAGDAFGAIALVYDCPRTATVKAKLSSRVWGVDGGTFREVLKEQSQQRYAETRKFLDTISLFDGLSSQQKDLVGQLAIVEETFEAGCCVISEGETTTAMYCVKRGELSVIAGGARDAATGKVAGGKKIATLRSGDCFGERAALYGEARSSTVVADVQSEVVCIGVPQMKQALGKDLAAYLQRSFLQSVLQKLPVITHLSTTQQARLVESMEVKVFGPGRRIEEDSRLIVVLDGEVASKRVGSGTILKRGEWCQDETLLQLSDLGPASGAKSGGSPGSGASPPKTPAGLRSGSAGCTVAVLTRDSMVSALVQLGFDGIGSGSKEEQVLNYIHKILGAKKVPVFRDLSQDQIEKLVNILVMRRYHQGAVIFHQGAVGHNFFVIASGEVRISIDSKTVRVLGKGACFGERAVLFDEPRTATVEVASESAEIWTLDRKDFRNVVTKDMREELVKRIQLQDTSVTLKALRHVRSIGAGSFGSVRLVEHRRTGLRYALKRVKKEDGGIPEELERECALLAELDHPFVLRLVKTFETKDSVYMLTELITGGQLFVQTNQRMGVLSRRQAQFYIASLIIILEVLHDRGIVYRDLKPENVMLDEQGYLKLVDFGLAKKLDRANGRTFSLVGTLYYLAPEVIRGKGYGTEVDIWSLGVMFFELVTGRLPFGDGKKCEHDILVSVLEDPLRFPGKYSDNSGRKLIQGMLNKRPEQRAGAKGWDDIKANKYFKAGVSGNIFNKIIGRELEAPVVPTCEEFTNEADLRGKVTLSDAEELGGAEDLIVQRVLQVFRKVKLGGDGRLNKVQLSKVLRVLDGETFNDQTVNRIWTAMGAQDGSRVQLEDFLLWISTDDGEEAFQKALGLEDIHS